MMHTVAVAPKAAAGAAQGGRARSAVVTKAHGKDTASKLVAGLSAAVIAGSAMLPPDAIAMAPQQPTEQTQMYVRSGQRDASQAVISGVAELPDPKKKLAEQEPFPSPVDLKDAAKTVKSNIKNISDNAGSNLDRSAENLKNEGIRGVQRTLEDATSGSGPKVVINRGEGGPLQVNRSALENTADAVKGSFQNTGQTAREKIDQTTTVVRRNNEDAPGLLEAGKGLVDSVKDSAENTKQAIFSTGEDASSKVKDATRGLQDAGSSARDKLDEAGRNIQKRVAFNFGGKDNTPDVNQAGKDLQNKAKDVSGSVKDAAENTKKAIFSTGNDASRKADDAKRGLQDAGNTARDKLNEAGRNVQKGVAFNFGGKDTPDVNQAGKDLQNKAKDVSGSVKDAAENTKKAIFSTGNDASRKAEDAKRGLQDAGNTARDKLDEAGRNVQKRVAVNNVGPQTNKNDVVQQSVKDLSDNAINATGKFTNSLQDSAQTTKKALYNAKDEASNKLQDVTRGVQGAGDSARDKLDDAGSSVKRNVQKSVAFNMGGQATQETGNSAREKLEESRRLSVTRNLQKPVAFNFGSKDTPDVNQAGKDLQNKAKDVSGSVKDAAENTKKAIFSTGNDASRKAEDAKRGLQDAGNTARDKLDEAGRSVNRNLQKPVSFPLTDVSAEPVSQVAFGKDIREKDLEGPNQTGKSTGANIKNATGAARNAILNARDETARKAQEATQGLQDTRLNPRGEGPSSSKKDSVAFVWEVPSRVGGVETVAFDNLNKNPGDKAREDGKIIKPFSGSENLVPTARNNASGGGLGQNYDDSLSVRQNFEKAKENFDNTSPKPPTGAPDFGKRFGAPNEVQGLKLSAGLGFPLFGQQPSLKPEQKAPQPNNPPITDTDPQAVLDGDIPSPTLPNPLPSPVSPYPLTRTKENVEAAERSMTPIPEPKPQPIKGLPTAKNATDALTN